jgi:hypothetical protein
MHHRDSKLPRDERVGRMNRFTVEKEFSSIRCVNSGKNFAQSAFTRAILADERVASAPLNFEAHAVQREHAGEAFGDVVERQKGHRQKLKDQSSKLKGSSKLKNETGKTPVFLTSDVYVSL